MIRVMLNITQCSPFLQTASGDVIVQSIDFRQDTGDQVRDLLKCKFSIKPGSVGYKNPEGYDAAIFEGIREKVDTMVHSYMRGLKMAAHDYSWVEDSADIDIDDWIAEKRRTYEKKYKVEHGRS